MQSKWLAHLSLSSSSTTSSSALGGKECHGEFAGYNEWKSVDVVFRLYPTEINSLSMRTKGAALGTATNARIRTPSR